MKQCKELNLKRHCKPLSVVHADNGFAAVNYVTFIISVRETKMESHKLANVEVCDSPSRDALHFRKTRTSYQCRSDLITVVSLWKEILRRIRGVK